MLASQPLCNDTASACLNPWQNIVCIAQCSPVTRCRLSAYTAPMLTAPHALLAGSSSSVERCTCVPISFLTSTAPPPVSMSTSPATRLCPCKLPPAECDRSSKAGRLPRHSGLDCSNAQPLQCSKQLGSESKHLRGLHSKQAHCCLRIFPASCTGALAILCFQDWPGPHRRCTLPALKR